MPKLTTTVTIATRKDRETVDVDVRVKTLEDLYRACQEAPAYKVMRVSIKGPDGEVRLNFASFIRKA